MALIKSTLRLDPRLKTLSKQISLLSTNINNRTKKTSIKQAAEIVVIMKRNAPVGVTGQLKNNIMIEKPSSNNKNQKVRIRSLSPYSADNEFGVEPHLVSAKTGNFKDWLEYAFVDEKNPTRTPGGLWVGSGPDSRVKFGHSRNQFFFNSIEEYLKGNKSRSQYVKGLREAIKEFKRGK